MHLVDVIIPTRNRAALTIEAASSVLSQTDQRWHLFIVDDASDDGSYEELQRIYSQDERVTLIRHDTVGRAARARQSGFDAGAAPWVATLDSDDRWTSSKLELQLQAAGEHDVVLGWHSWVRPDGSIRVTRRPSGEGSVSCLFTANVDVALMRRDLVARVGAFAGPGVLDLVADENIDFFIRLLAEANVVVVPEVVALCRDHEGSRTSDSMTPESLATIVAEHRSKLDGDPLFSDLLCRLGARHFRAGNRSLGWRVTLEGLSKSDPTNRFKALREYGPHAVRRTLVRRQISRPQ